jgi:hypothetical protein
MKLKLDRIISIATLVALLVAIVLLLKKPTPVVFAPQAPPAATDQSFNAPSSNTQSSSQKAGGLEPVTKQAPPAQPGAGYSAGPSATSQPSQTSVAPPSAKSEAHSNSDAVNAAINKLLGASGAGLTPDSNVGDGAPNIKDQKVTYDGDTVHGQFLTEIAGKDVWITISGHMGQKDGYATFDPTEFKVGGVEVPVSLVNPALQRKLAEERDRLKLSDPAK